MTKIPKNFHILKISGPDAKKFLQGQLTCHLEELVPGQPQLAAHCNPQGRVISLFHLVLDGDAYLLCMPESMIPIAEAALKKYAIFYKVAFAAMTSEGDEANKGPMVFPETSGKFLPHELNLDTLGAVSFNKGCYTGQEIIARMHYRGKLKNHLHQATVTTDTAPLPDEEVYYQSNNEIISAGTIVNNTENENNQYTTLFICDDELAKTQSLFIHKDTPTPLTDIILFS